MKSFTTKISQTLSILALTLGLTFSANKAALAQVEVGTGVDLVSTYVWRGVAYSGPSWQPYVEASAGSFSIGAWGSQGYDGFQEMDLYASFSLGDLSIGFTDYYYPGSDYLSGDSHAFEINAGYALGSISIAANYIVNEAADAGSAGGDMYFELGYSGAAADVFIGAGDGWHSSTGDFGLVNIGVTKSKEIKITEHFSLPVSGAVIFNPDSEQLYILAGISL
jgi:hypothetical protein